MIDTTKNIQLFLGDCLEVMKEIPDKSIDLVLTDPPYGVRKIEKWDNKSHFLALLNIWLDECERVGKTTLWFCAGKMLPFILKKDRNFKRLLIWNKPAGSQFAGAMNSNLWYSLEPILVFGELPKTDKTKKYGYSSFEFRTVSQKEFGHPTTKPLGLMQELVYFHSNKNDLILDPFMGSGTTGVACKMLNRKFIGIEISEEYMKIAQERIKNTQVTEKLAQV